ncbi:MAG: M48 family metalloprotease [Gemmatimonas sp.]
MTSTESATQPAKPSALFNVLLGVVVVAVLGSMVWGWLVGRQPVAPLIKAMTLPVDSSWYQTLPINPEAAANKYLERIPPALRARNDALGFGDNLTTVLYIIRNVAAIVLLMFSGAIARIERLTARISSRPFIRRTFVLLFVYAVYWALAFPLVTYQSWVLQYHAGPMYAMYWDGLSTMVVAGMVSALLFAAQLTVLYALARGSTRRVLVILISGVSLWLMASILGQPLIDRYVADAIPISIDQSSKMQKIQAFADSNGVHPGALWLQHVGQQEGNYESATAGVGSTAHILMDADMFQDLSIDELKYVLGHEFGHLKRHDVLTGLLTALALTSLSWLLVAWMSGKLLARYHERWDVRNLTDIRALPLVWGVFALMQIAAIPVNNALARDEESAADQYALQATNRPTVMADYLMRGEIADAHPSPFIEYVFYDHPSLYSRVLAAMRWRAAHELHNQNMVTPHSP